MNRVKVVLEPIDSKYKDKCISSSKDISVIIEDTYKYAGHEIFSVMYLTRQNRIIAIELPHTMGTSTGTIVDTQRIVRTAINLNAQNVICVHNHPSNYIKPSQEDITITQNLSKALGYFGIKLLDHVIVNSEVNDYYSFADNGLEV